MTEKERKRFIRDLFEYGVYVLPCGGGVFSEPRHAIYYLEDKYGRNGLLYGCWELVQNDNIELPEGVGGTAWGVVYHLADDAFLSQLIAERTEHRFDHLIAYSCHRLKRPVPDGIAPLTEEQLQNTFPDEPELPTLAENVKDALLGLIFLPVFVFDEIRTRWRQRHESSVSAKRTD